MGLQATRSSNQVQPRLHGPFGVVFMRLGIPEIDQDSPINFGDDRRYCTRPFRHGPGNYGQLYRNLEGAHEPRSRGARHRGGAARNRASRGDPQRPSAIEARDQKCCRSTRFLEPSSYLNGASTSWHIALNISSGISTEGLWGAPRIVIGPILPPLFSAREAKVWRLCFTAFMPY